jgi:hypothetical protein
MRTQIRPMFKTPCSIPDQRALSSCKIVTPHGRIMREAVSLVGGYGITEDCRLLGLSGWTRSWSHL